MIELTGDSPGIFKCRDQEKIGCKIETEEHTYCHAQVGRYSHSPVPGYVVVGDRLQGGDRGREREVIHVQK